jgi:hypothetical protein
MKRLYMTLCTLVITVSLASNTHAAGLSLTNGGFDLDPDLGGADDPVNPPTSWFAKYTIDQSWSDFRFGNNGNGGWANNGIALGQNYLGPTFEPGPEDGFFYTLLGAYGGELSARIDGFGYNRINGNQAGAFQVGLYYSAGGAFAGANGTDVATSSVLLGGLSVDISALTGTTARSQAFTLPVTFAGSGIHAGDHVWLRIGDGPDDGNLNTFDEPIIDNLTLTTVVPEPSSFALCLVAAVVAPGVGVLRRRRRPRA